MFGCPVSTKRLKKDIQYVTPDERRAIAEETLRTRLATYQYTVGAPDSRLGFIIEDDPTSPAVIHDKDRVDLYGYTSMAVATLQVQNEEIAELRAEVEALRSEVAKLREHSPR
jgi:hypothetical protein